MYNFIFRNPTKLVFGQGQIAQLATLIPTHKRIMMTYGAEPWDFIAGGASATPAYKPIGPKASSKPCSNFMYSASMALNGFISMGVPQDWTAHQIGQELTARQVLLGEKGNIDSGRVEEILNEVR